MTRRAIFRCDAGPGIGAGHLIRCAALAEALESDGWDCGFAMDGGAAETVRSMLPQAPHRFAWLDGGPDGEARRLRAVWPEGCELLVVDHYGRDAEFERACRPWAKRILAIDDLADRPHDCDFLLDQTLGRAEADYAGLVPGHCRMLLGPGYALLRRQFARARARSLAERRPANGIRRIFVSFGGTDGLNLTPVALAGIAESGLTAAVDVVLGPQARSRADVERRFAALAAPCRAHVNPTDVAAVMGRADIAIGAAGTMSWERCCLGLPSLAVVSAGNQRQIAAALAGEGAAIELGRGSDVTPSRVADGLHAVNDGNGTLAAMSAAAASICDGMGTQRIAGLFAP